MNTEFDEIRPYHDEELPQVFEELIADPAFRKVAAIAMPGVPVEAWAQQMRACKTKLEFQIAFCYNILKRIIKEKTDGLTMDYSALEAEPNRAYTYISNHRDIILDSAILNIMLRRQGCHYCEAAIGSNLLINNWVTDLVKLDACFIIERGLPVRDMISSANLRSHYLRDVILENKDSVWIAQKEGRTKNGDDRTQPSLLKMFRMSGPSDFVKNFKELRVTPVSISYEWEPCDALKTDELYQKTVGEYVKTPAADMQSMLEGLSVYKGRVNFAITPPLDQELDYLEDKDNHGDRIAELATLVDERIHKNFKLWPNNYIAYDLMHSTTQFADKYSEEEKTKFIQVMTQKIDKLSGNRSILNNIFLEIYANPVKNNL